MAAALTSYYVGYGDWRKLFTGIDEIDKVTADDVQRVAKQYLIPDARTVAWIVCRTPPTGRRRNEDRSIVLTLLLAPLAIAQTEVHRGPVNLPSYKELKYPPLPPLKIPKPVEFTLSNGMKVFLLEDHELPLVSGGALVRTGNLFDPADKHGVAQLTGEVLALRRHQDKDRRSDR